MTKLSFSTVRLRHGTSYIPDDQHIFNFLENENSQAIRLPVFTELLDLTSKVNKVISTPAGSIVLAGRTGVGRKSAIKIVSSMQNSRVISVAESNQQFKIDVKSVSEKSLRCLKLIFTYYTFYVIQMLQTAGIDCQSVFLIVEDHVLKYKFLHDTLNNLISTGEAIDLYTTTELETIVAPLRDQLEQDGFEGSLINYFNKSKYNSDLEHLNHRLDVQFSLQFYSCSQWASMKCVFFF